MPLFNPDGYEYTQTNDRNWQKNRGQTSNNFCPGTDLSRNYPNAEWGVGGSANPCSEEYNGVVPGSEIETDAHISLLTDNNIDAYLTITGYGQTVSYPYNTEKESQYWNEIEPIARKIAQTMSQVWKTSDDAAVFRWGKGRALIGGTNGGASEDFVHDMGVKHSFRINMRDDGSEGFYLQEKYIPIATDETIAGIKTLITEITKPYYPNFRNIFDYIAWDDGKFEWNIIDMRRYETFDFYTMNMTSQQWLTEADTDRPIWWHTVAIAVPHNLDPEMSESALLCIYGKSSPVDSSEARPIYPEDNRNAEAIGKIATDTGGIAINLFFIPNQHIQFVGDWDPDFQNRGRVEDQIIAFTWKRFVDTPDLGPQLDEPHWLIRYPMVKATIKAMDAVNEWSLSNGWPKKDKFTITGASKRGWTTWIAGGVDPRINAIVPMVDTFVDIPKILHGHYQALGGWSFAFYDYYKEELTRYLDTPGFDALCEQVDPLSYKENLTMPIVSLTSFTDS